MKVEQILQSKGAEVFTVNAGDTIANAVSLLNEKNIGAVVVKDHRGAIAGILSERDIVRMIGASGVDVMAMQVSDCMTPDPVTCSSDATLEELMEKMTNKRVRHLPIINGDNVVGLVSIGDVVKRKIDIAEQEAQALKEYIAT